MAESAPQVAIVILNWNGWRDTIECLESVFRLDYSVFKVIVCDNGSEDGSLDQIRAWAEGKLSASVDGAPWKKMLQGVVKKPVTFVKYDRATAESGGDPAVEQPLVLIQTGGNLGFAGGNNVGLRYAMSRENFAYVWLLNNDTVVKPDALKCMVDRMCAKPDAGICGSKLVFYHQPNLVQALGGAGFDDKKMLVKPIGMFQDANAQCDESEVEAQMAYVVGASMLVSLGFLREIGLMSEDYFLYFEEIDWAIRAKGRFSLAFSPESVVYHKEGATIGSSSTGKQSLLATRLLYQNRVRFVRKFFRKRLMSCLIQIGWEFLVMLKRRQYRACGTAVKAVLIELLHPGLPYTFRVKGDV